MAIIRKKKMADAVIEEIKRMIETGELTEGDKLPNQNEFSAQLNVSRTSLREALRVLDLLGAIEQRPGFGTVIRKYNPVLFSNALVAPPLMSDEQATRELLKAREVVEIGAAELAAVNASEEQIRTMSALVEELGAALEKGLTEEYIDKDMAFHTLVSESTQNRFLVYSFQTLRGFIEQYMRECFEILPGVLNSSIKLHRNICRAISQGEPENAGRAMKEHTEYILDNYELYTRNILEKKSG
ncbi:MAG: FadR family transcriptional regulator [Proteobacteria bacterium]|nr:FadR family transcriptional regulator [Pseudomonadota bacterium]